MKWSGYFESMSLVMSVSSMGRRVGTCEFQKHAPGHKANGTGRPGCKGGDREKERERGISCPLEREPLPTLCLTRLTMDIQLQLLDTLDIS